MRHDTGQLSTEQDDLFRLLDILEQKKIPYWLEGGWGVDAVLGKQTREHRDADIDFDRTRLAELRGALEKEGYRVTTDWLPCRLEMTHDQRGYVDLHPLFIHPDGSAEQAGVQGEVYPFPREIFSVGQIAGRQIPCISAAGQIEFHKGYDWREKDRADVENLHAFLDMQTENKQKK